VAFSDEVKQIKRFKNTKKSILASIIKLLTEQ
jgi:hypothetical protein